MAVGNLKRNLTLAALAAGGALALLAVALPAFGQAPPSPPAGPGPPDGARIATVRMYQTGQFTTKHQDPASIGAELASLDPTYVSALLRYPKGGKVRGREVQAWNTVVAAVREASPDVKFDVELNAMEYPTGKSITNMMSYVRGRIDPDGWLFDFYTPAAKKKPKVVKAAIAAAHENGEFLGGNAFGIANNPVVPAGTDYIAVQDFGFDINMPAVRQLAQRSTVLFHLGNSPAFTNSDGCQFIEDLSNKKRIAYVTKRADQQAANKFRFGYPVFFPECARDRGHREDTLFSYDAPNDVPMMNAIRALMDKYEAAAPSTPPAP